MFPAFPASHRQVSVIHPAPCSYGDDCRGGRREESFVDGPWYHICCLPGPVSYACMLISVASTSSNDERLHPLLFIAAAVYDDFL